MSFFKKGLRVIPLTQWLDWASGQNNYDQDTKQEVFIALPMIQRGSVWKPVQIINLWDSLLRGMPVGSLLLSHMTATNKDGLKVKVRKFNKNELSDLPKNGGLGLLDGQQRTLSMLLAWPGMGEYMDKKIWIDFADEPSNETRFRFHVTTLNQPFGFQRYEPNSKLSLGDRQKARIAYDEKQKKAIPKECISRESIFQTAEPWESYLPVELIQLINVFNKQGESALRSFVLQKLEGTKSALGAAVELLARNMQEPARAHLDRRLRRLEEDGVKEKIANQIERFLQGMKRVNVLQIPLIEVGKDTFETDDSGENIDPPLAVLFKRVGTGGTALTDADYIYSVIKHQLPDAYQLVEDLSQEETIARRLSATNIVMTAVRLVAAKLGLADSESPSKTEFHRLLKTDSFASTFHTVIAKGGDLPKALIALTEVLSYKGGNDIGLPRHAWILLDRPLIQVLLRWKLHSQPDSDALINSRDELLRFILYWVLCVKDQKKASKLLFTVLHKDNPPFPIFNGELLAKILKAEGIALPVIQPEILKQHAKNAVISENVKGIRGWKRFHIDQSALFECRCSTELYSRWWSLAGNHIHPLLLWLQREYVNTFKGFPAADQDEETPYDYDHICPSNHWSDWTGITGKNRLIDFHDSPEDKEGHWRLGNSIGNMRVWDSSDNRSLGSASPKERLHLREQDVPNLKLLVDSAINENERVDWVACSGKDNPRHWDEVRAKAFQRVIETRAFNLYTQFHDRLKFYGEYVSIPASE